MAEEADMSTSSPVDYDPIRWWAQEYVDAEGDDQHRRALALTLLNERDRLVLALGARNTEAELTWIEENGRLQAIIDVLLPVAQVYMDAFRDDEKMTMPERLRLQQVEDILNDPENWSPAEPIGGE